MAEERNPVSVTIKCQCQGFGLDLTAELLVSQIPGLIGKLKSAGIEPANSPYVWPAQTGQSATPAPTCPVHGTIMKPSKHKDGEYFCSAPIGLKPDGSKAYCQEKVTQ